MPLRLLLVEDSERDAELLLLALEEGGFDVAATRVDSPEALSAALDAQEWDAVISDYSMPQFDGLAALEIAKQRKVDAPFIIVSGTIGEDVAVQAMRAGAHDYLLKDNLNRLVPAVQRELSDAQARRQQRETDTLYRTLTDISPDAIVVVDLTGNIVISNAQAALLFGYDAPDAMSEVPAVDLLIEADRERIAEGVRHMTTTGTAIRNAEYTARRRDGSTFPLEISMSLIRNSGGDPVAVLGVMRDITERKIAEQTLTHLALHDSLTGLPNRVLLHDRLNQAVAASRRGHTSLGLLLLDLDRFKEVNDTFGHAAGDDLLKQLGPRLQATIRESDTVARPRKPGHTVARLGGDEFAVLLSGVGELAATAVATRLLATLQDPFLIEGQGLDIGASIGIALYPQHGGTSDALLRCADVAMYQAKHRGGGYALYEPRQDQHTHRRLVLMNQLRRAIESGQLRLHYQPKIDATTGHLAAAEALVRWEHPEYGLVGPDEFIPLAEQTGLMKLLTEWVLTEAVRECAAWHAAGLYIHVLVNLSARSLHDQQLVDVVRDILAAAGVEPAWLGLEITEGALMADPDRALDVLQRMADMGLGISVDDFGTGYSSLRYLDQLPAQELKIDRSFVLDIDENDSHRRIVRSTISLGHDLGLTVVAEGVENQTAWDHLREMGCDTVQGNFVSHPLPPAAFVEWARGHIQE